MSFKLGIMFIDTFFKMSSDMLDQAREEAGESSKKAARKHCLSTMKESQASSGFLKVSNSLSLTLDGFLFETLLFKIKLSFEFNSACPFNVLYIAIVLELVGQVTCDHRTLALRALL
jgi:hypothetical protein